VYNYTQGVDVSELKRTNIMLPVDLKRKARAKAILEGKTLSSVIRDLLKEYVKDYPPKEPEQGD
jgi:hypothetical protein